MSANERQVGGDHYKVVGKMEHWDIVAQHDLDYFQGQITKYLMRWRTKHLAPEKQLEDLQKGLHFYEKYLELARAKIQSTESPNITQIVGEREPWGTPPERTLRAFEHAAGHYLSDSRYLCEGGWGSRYNLYTCRICRREVHADGLEQAHLQHDHLNCRPPLRDTSTDLKPRPPTDK